jgi:uncharacterized membrane protein YphA (DoxX/SURF4 family)
MLKDKSESSLERLLIVFFRLTIGWTFLWAAIHHFGDDRFVTGFLSNYPYIESINNYLVDYHIVYAGVLVYLIVKRAGHVFGFDGWAEELMAVRQTPALRWLVSAA